MGFLPIFMAVVIVILIGAGIAFGITYVILMAIEHLGEIALTVLTVIIIGLILTTLIYSAQ